MKRTNLNFVVDATAFVGFVLLTTTGILMRYVLPPGSGHRSAIWGMDRHEWGGIHFWVSVGFFAVLAVHLALHWRWIACVATGRPHDQSGWRVGLGAVGLAAVIAFALAPLLSPVQKSSDPGNGSFLSSHDGEDEQIQGSMSLAEVEQRTGVPAAYIAGALGLPAGTPADQQIGRLRKTHGFEMSDLRKAVRTYSGDK